MGEFLTIEEIEHRYAPDWVLINNPQTDENCRVLAGEVILTGNNSDELYRKATEWDLENIAVRYLGPGLKIWLSSCEFGAILTLAWANSDRSPCHWAETGLDRQVSSRHGGHHKPVEGVDTDLSGF